MATWSKEVFARNLKKYMEGRGKTQRELAEIVGVSAPTVNEWIKAKKYPRIDKIEIMADYFGILKSDLIEENSNTESTQTKGIRIPVLGSVRAGIPLEAIEDIVDYEEIPEAMARSGEYFGLMIRGDSMSPVFVEGDVVIVRKQESADTGDAVIALVNGDEATIKRLKRTQEGIVLIPNNPEYLPMVYTNEQIKNLPVRILGKVIELRRKF